VAAVERAVTRVTDPLVGTSRTGYRLRPVESENGPLTRGPDLVKYFSKIQTQLKIVTLNPVPSRCPKILKLYMEIDLNILNNFFDWVDLKFPTEYML
jgi:hypothetical protein